MLNALRNSNGNIPRASTTAPARTITETGLTYYFILNINFKSSIYKLALVPDTSNTNYKFSNLDLALGLGLSLPLLLIGGGLVFCKCCCKQCKCFRYYVIIRSFKKKTFNRF